MKIFRDLKKIDSKYKNSVLIPGNFDGVHLGHQKLITYAKNLAIEENLKTSVMTFSPHPRRFFDKNLKLGFITNLKQKIIKLKELGIDIIFLIQFNQDFANLSAEQFIKQILINQLKIKHIIVGNNFIFGRNQTGNLNLLKEYESKKYFRTHQVPPYQIPYKINQLSPVKFSNNIPLPDSTLLDSILPDTALPNITLPTNIIISSTLIRKTIKAGDMIATNSYLGHNFTITGRVITGQKLARNLGFPTANIKPNPQLVQLKYGVYKVQVQILNKNDKTIKYNAIANYGIKPTIEKNHCPLLEIHIPNFSGDLYNYIIQIEFLSFIRSEQKFKNIEALKYQIQQDISLINNA